MATRPPLFYLQAGSLRKRLVVYFFSHPGKEHYVRELARVLKADATNLSRELAVLAVEGMFRFRTEVLCKYFRLNPAYPFFAEMKAIVEKMGPGPGFSGAKPAASLYVIAGPNGAGKTTFAKTFLPDYLGCKTFINADLIASGVAPLAPEQAALKAGKLLIEEIRSHAARKADFGFETTLAGKRYAPFFEELRLEGYAIHLFFLWIPTVELALKRIADRVRRGGHPIPPRVARRRFHRGLQNLFNLYEPLLSSWTLFDNSGPAPETVAYRENEKLVVLNDTAYRKLKRKAGGA